MISYCMKFFKEADEDKPCLVFLIGLMLVRERSPIIEHMTSWIFANCGTDHAKLIELEIKVSKAGYR